jgi:hypothetical protein
MRLRIPSRVRTALLIASLGIFVLLVAPSALANWNEPAAGPLNVDPTKNAATGEANESITSVGGVSYVAWQETDGSGVTQVRVKSLGGAGWKAVGGSLNVDPTRDAFLPSITSINGVPYVAFEQTTSSATQIRVKSFDGSAWTAVGSSPLNFDPTEGAFFPSITSIGGVPYVAWSEHHTANNNGQIRVKSFNGTNWNEPVPGPLNIDPTGQASNPSITDIGGIPYVAWEESGIHVKSFNGSAWNLIGGSLGCCIWPRITSVAGVPYVAWGGSNGISGVNAVRVAWFDGSFWRNAGSPLNVDPTESAFLGPSIATIGGVPYVAWSESNGTSDKTHVKSFDGDNWNAIGGPLNVVRTHEAALPSITGLGGVPYVAWSEYNGTNNQIRVKRLEPDIGAENATPSLTGATLSAQVNDFGVPLPVGFEFGPTSSFGTQTALQRTSGGGTSTLTQPLTGLAPATIYFFRAFGSDTFRETSQGATQTFRTLTPAAPLGPAVISNDFTFTLGTDRQGDIIAIVHDPGPGSLTGNATTKAKGKIRTATAARRHKHKKKAKTFTYGTGSATSTGPGTVTLTIRPTGQAKRALKKAKRLSVGVSITYTPTGGKPNTKTASITVTRAKKAKKHKHH